MPRGVFKGPRHLVITEIADPLEPDVVAFTLLSKTVHSVSLRIFYDDPLLAEAFVATPHSATRVGQALFRGDVVETIVLTAHEDDWGKYGSVELCSLEAQDPANESHVHAVRIPFRDPTKKNKKVDS